MSRSELFLLTITSMEVAVDFASLASSLRPVMFPDPAAVLSVLRDVWRSLSEEEDFKILLNITL